MLIDKEYALTLNNKAAVYKAQTKTIKQINMALISANGLKQNLYSQDSIDYV